MRALTPRILKMVVDEGGFRVEMRYQPERALTHTWTKVTKLQILGRNEVSAREGIDTRASANKASYFISVEMR